MDVSKMTRMQAERAVTATTDPELLKKLGDHKNKHVRQKAAFKALVPEDRKVATMLGSKCLERGLAALSGTLHLMEAA